MEIVGYEVDETGSPLALDNGEFTEELQRENEIVKNLNIMDDVFFHKMAEDKGFCEEILQTILEDDSLVVVENEPQKYLRNVGAKSVILDVLCRDALGRRMNVEVQKADD